MNSNKKTTLLFIIIFIIFIVINIYLLKSKNDSSTINIEENKEQKTDEGCNKLNKSLDSLQEETNKGFDKLNKSLDELAKIYNEENKEQKTELTTIEKPQKIEIPKTEIETKISISQARFDEIKNYILSLDDNSLPNGLSTNEKTQIEKIKNSIKYILKTQNSINDELNKIYQITN